MADTKVKIVKTPKRESRILPTNRHMVAVGHTVGESRDVAVLTPSRVLTGGVLNPYVTGILKRATDKRGSYAGVVGGDGKPMKGRVIEVEYSGSFPNGGKFQRGLPGENM
jgi:hypothetical protein